MREPRGRWWNIKEVSNDRPTWRPRRVRKSSPPISTDGAKSDEEREENGHVDNMYQRKHD